MASILNRINSLLKSFFSYSQSENKLVERFSQSRRARLEALESRELLAAYPYPSYYGPPTFEEYQAFLANETSTETALVAQASNAESLAITINAPENTASCENRSSLLAELSAICIEEIDETDELVDSVVIEENYASEYCDVTEVLLDLSDETITSEDESVNLNVGGDSTQSGGSGGSDLLKPYVSGGGSEVTQAYYDVVLNADLTSSATVMNGGWCISPDPSLSVTYSIQTQLNFVNVSVNANTGDLSITPNGLTESGSFTVIGTNGYGNCVATIMFIAFVLPGSPSQSKHTDPTRGKKFLIEAVQTKRLGGCSGMKTAISGLLSLKMFFLMTFT